MFRARDEVRIRVMFGRSNGAVMLSAPGSDTRGQDHFVSSGGDATHEHPPLPLTPHPPFGIEVTGRAFAFDSEDAGSPALTGTDIYRASTYI